MKEHALLIRDCMIAGLTTPFPVEVASGAAEAWATARLGQAGAVQHAVERQAGNDHAK